MPYLTAVNPRRLWGILTATALGLSSCQSYSPQLASPPVASQTPLKLQVASPDWRDQIIYFLLIDRFNDGNTANNDQGYGEYNPRSKSHYSGGDIPGITAKLDYLKNLGMTSVWLTPPVANQWWSNDSDYAGYHGYWARDFQKVDEHYGTLEDYQQLSHELHRRDMYLIQDIVVNHTGIYFGYRGDYDPTATQKNFVLLEQGHQAAPDMPPFHMVDRNNPEHAQANIYNWTPSTSNYASEAQQFRYQLGNLADINTTNPAVLKAFKQAYGYWMEEVGVDAFRIDTVKYVEHAFWHHFLQDDDGIHARAKALGKNHFLTFGEVFEASKPFTDDGEQKVTRFLGTPEKPELNSVIGFPLYFEINRVLGEGKPVSQLAYRLNQFMSHYPNPHVTPNFIDNHDTQRFLASANHAAMQQALALLFTIPGIPVIYQGTEQAHEETRQAMFAEGYFSKTDQFDQTAPFYQLIQRLAQIRTQHRVFTRGDMKLLYAEQAGPGVLVFTREYQEHTALVVINTADHSTLLSDLKTNIPSDTSLQLLYASDGNRGNAKITDRGTLSLELPPRGVAIYLNSTEPTLTARHLASTLSNKKHKRLNLVLDPQLNGKTFTQNFPLKGRVNQPNVALKLLINGNLDQAQSIKADAEGRWLTSFPVNNLGQSRYSLQLYAPEYQQVSNKVQFQTQVDTPQLMASIKDASDDAKGITGSYRQPEQKKQSAANGDIGSRGQKRWSQSCTHLVHATDYRYMGTRQSI